MPELQHPHTRTPPPANVPSHVIVLADHATADGGAPKVAITAARALAELGLTVTYLHGVGAADSPADALLDHPAITRIGLGLADIWSLPLASAARDGIWNAAAQAGLALTLKRLSRPGTVVHLHQWTKALSPAVFAALRDSGLPFAVTLHDYFIACPTGVFYRFDTGKPCPLTPLSLSCLAAPCDPRSRAHKAVRVARQVAQNAVLKSLRYHVVHVSDRGARTVAPHLPGRPVQHRIDNPVGNEQQAPAEPAAATRAVYVGRFTWEKGAVLAAEATRLARIPALFVGGGPAEDAIRAANPDAEVRGWLDPEAVTDLLRREARVLLAPSLWPETGPLTVFEALANGIPVIGSTLSGAAETVRHGVSGFVVPPDAASFASALAELDAARAALMGAAAYDQYWAAPPTPANHAAALYALYTDMLTQS